MKQNIIRRFLVLICVAALLITGCNATVSIKSNTPPTTAPTAKIANTAIIVPTATPKPTTQPTPTMPKMVIYTHPSNSFSISVPEDWTKAENTGYVLFSSPDQTVFVELAAENTIETLSAEAFTNAINAFEFNVYSGYKNYKETKRDVQADKGYAVVAKDLDVNKVPFQVATIYEQKEKALFIESYYSAVSVVSATGPIFTAMDNSFKTNPAYVADLSPFTSTPFTFTDPNNLYSLLIPSLWTQNDTKKNGSVVTYTSPDSNAIIMLVKIDLGKTVTRALADTTALDMLRNMFSDMRVAKTEILKNGSIQLNWAPKSGGLQGLSIYKWSGTQWFFLTWMANAGFENIYGPVFNQSIPSYTLPQ